ncbi:MAG: SIMPL domain-containing protein [Burkholderiaceae bacterium]|nr:SIMPL domain-containing protein [Burkholderiaceae bacterium]
MHPLKTLSLKALSLKALLIAPAAVLMLAGAIPAQAQSAPTSGTLVIVPAYGEVTQPNDRSLAMLAIEEQDRDKAAAASRVNQKMNRGIEIIKQQDPQAILKTQNYYTYPVYAEERSLPSGAAPRPRVPASWRVGQSLQVTTTRLGTLPKTIAAAQSVLTLNHLHFDLSPQAMRKLDDQRIAATYQNLQERVASIAAAMGRKPSDAVLDTVDFEASGAYAPQDSAAPMAMRSAMQKGEAAPVQEPSFEPGETTLQMRLVGKLRFK